MAKKVRGGVEIDTTRWSAMKKRLLKDQNLEVQVGAFSGARYGKGNNNLPVAQVMQWNEEGHRNGGRYDGTYTPPRPFMRTFFFALHKSPVFQKFLALRIKGIFEGTHSWRNMYEDAGEFVEEGLKMTVDKWSTPPNKASTIKEKGFNDPLIETGKMRNSIKYRIKKVAAIKMGSGL
tara:strand:+ start:27916 stop:28446 length:531 start_codon:yes stop_codon:yes gene_type:complete